MSAFPRTGHRVVPQSTSPRAAVLRDLQAVYEANYLRLVRLAPGLRAGEGRCFLLADGRGEAARVTLRVGERGPWTTVVEILEEGDGEGWLAPMAARVRLYHDARLAEVLELQRRRRLQAWYPYPNEAMHQPDEKLQANRFLGEWLAHCRLHGAAPAGDAGGARGHQ